MVIVDYCNLKVTCTYTEFAVVAVVVVDCTELYYLRQNIGLNLHISRKSKKHRPRLHCNAREKNMTEISTRKRQKSNGINLPPRSLGL